MKKTKIIYATTTGLICLWMMANAWAYLFSDQAKVLCNHFGFPDYFRIELAIAKFIGVAILLLPIVKSRLKEWSYAGFVITVISGFIAHLSSGDPVRASSSPLMALAILMTSYFSYHRLQAMKMDDPRLFA